MLGKPLTRMHPDWQIVEKVGREFNPHLVMDIGARNGWFFQSWLDWQPNATIIAFDPEVNAYDALKKRYANDPRVRIEPYGIAEKSDTQTFYTLSESAVSSSLLQPDQKVWDEIKYDTGDIIESTIETITLDDYCQQHAIDNVYLIKMDIQGYELRALEGAINTLASTDYVLVESAIKPLYEGAATFTEVHDFMTEQGFHLMDIRSWHRGNHVLIETDLLYRRNGLEPNVDKNAAVDREYTAR